MEPAEHAGEEPVIPVADVVAETVPEPRGAADRDPAVTREPNARS